MKKAPSYLAMPPLPHTVEAITWASEVKQEELPDQLKPIAGKPLALSNLEYALGWQHLYEVTLADYLLLTREKEKLLIVATSRVLTSRNPYSTGYQLRLLLFHKETNRFYLVDYDQALFQACFYFEDTIDNLSLLRKRSFDK